MKRFYHLSCKGENPYPVPVDLKPDRRMARMLLSSYAGLESEMTAIHQYIYHFLEAGECYRPMAFALKQIAEVEMHHLGMLGNCIRQLGGEPRYWSWRGQMRQYWNGAFVKYGKDMKGMLEADLLGEYEAIESYRSLARRVGEPQISALICRIIEDEEIHVGILESMLLFLGQ